MKETVTKGLKIAFACMLSILVAMIFRLDYAITAGIITILSIGNTKKETFRTARNRTLAFLCALLIAAVSFYGIGFNTIGFSVYILCFVMVCLLFHWQEAIAMDSVLISHVLAQGCFSWELLFNEGMLFLIGIGFGILVNMLLRRKNREFEALAMDVDNEMKGILERMSGRILTEDKSDYNGDCFVRLEAKINKAQLCAMRNYDNSLLDKSIYELDYVEMRQKQSMVLAEIYKSIVMIQVLPKQVHTVGEFLKQVAEEYHRDNDVEDLLNKLQTVFKDMEIQELPKSREEFEARAVLYYILKQMEEFLRLKNVFVMKQNQANVH